MDTNLMLTGASAVYGIDVDSDGDIDVLTALDAGDAVQWYVKLTPHQSHLHFYHPHAHTADARVKSTYTFNGSLAFSFHLPKLKS